MPKSAHKKHKPLEVSIMFEPTRLAPDYLQAAYTHLVPTHQRRIQTATSQTQHDHNAPRAERNDS
jgi:hypothetical protein